MTYINGEIVGQIEINEARCGGRRKRRTHIHYIYTFYDIMIFFYNNNLKKIPIDNHSRCQF